MTRDYNESAEYLLRKALSIGDSEMLLAVKSIMDAFSALAATGTAAIRQAEHAARLEGIRLAVLYYDPDLTEKGVQGEVADIVARLEKGEK